MHDEGREKKEITGLQMSAGSNDCVKTAQRKLAGKDGGAGISGKKIKGDSVMKGFSVK